MDAALQASSINWTATGDYYTAFNRYNAARASLGRTVDSIQANADQILTLAEQAARLSEGEKFRILGIGVQLSSLAMQLGFIAQNLQAEINGLNALSLGDTDASNATLLAMANTINELTQKQTDVAAKAAQATGFLGQNINAYQAANDDIATLNGKYAYLDGILQEVGFNWSENENDNLPDIHSATTWAEYFDAEGAFETDLNNICVITGNNNPDLPDQTGYQAAAELLNNAPVQGVQGDQLAMQGVRYFVNQYISYLNAEAGRVTEIGTWLIDTQTVNNDLEDAIGDLNGMLDNTSSARDLLQTLLQS
jgi:hypothetical protein